MAERKRLIHLHHCRGIGWKGIKKILSKDPDLDFLYNLTVNALIHDFGFRREYAEHLYQDLHSIDIENVLENYEKDGIKVITKLDMDYPQQLANIYDPPWVLYIKGNEKLLKNKHMLSVVGTRNPTKDGLTSLDYIISPLVDRSWTIVSGMAMGIDGAAHRMALRSSTIAVLGSGLYHPYPKRHLSLFNEMVRNHLVISEYPPNQPPKKWQFPERNRIISGLSFGTLVVEAKEKSGSLITADQALDQGREVFALPGNIFNINTKGTHGLIQQGAQLITCAEEIISEQISLSMV